MQEHQEAALYVDQQSGGYYGDTAAIVDSDQYQPAAPVRIVASGCRGIGAVQLANGNQAVLCPPAITTCNRSKWLQA